MTCDRWHVTCNTWHVTCDTWLMTRDMWHVTCDTWHVTHDTWCAVIILPKFQLSSSKGLANWDLWCCEYLEEKDQWRNSSINYLRGCLSNSPGYTGSLKHNIVTIVIMTFCCHVIMSSCWHVFISLCCHVVLSSCPPVIMAHVVILYIMSVCHNVCDRHRLYMAEAWWQFIGRKAGGKRIYHTMSFWLAI